MYSEITVSGNIPVSKLTKAFKTGSLNLTASELRGTGAVLHLHPESYAKAIKAHNAHKGVRLQITKHEVKKGYKRAQGGSIWRSGVKGAFKFAKDSGLLSQAAGLRSLL